MAVTNDDVIWLIREIRAEFPSASPEQVREIFVNRLMMPEYKEYARVACRIVYFNIMMFGGESDSRH